MTVGIYGWFDKETGQCLYVGQSSNIEKRKKSHLKSLKSRKHSRKDFSEYYHQKDNKEDIYLKILEETKNDLKIKNAAEIKWFIELKPLFYGMKPDESYYCFTATEETKKLISKNIKNSNKEVSQVCTVCKTNLTFRQNGVCVECNDKRNKEIIKENKKLYNVSLLKEHHRVFPIFSYSIKDRYQSYEYDPYGYISLSC